MAIIVDFGLLVFLIFLYRFMTLAFLGASVLLQRDLEEEQSPQSNTVPETYIKNPVLAEAMAYGEKPYRELALEADRLGLPKEVEAMNKKANKAGVQAGAKFVEEQQIAVDAMRANLEVSTPTVEKESSFETRIAATKWALAEHYNKPEEEFELISYKTEDGKTTHVVMYTGNKGIDLGDSLQTRDEIRSYNSLMADDSHFIKIDGEKYDTRTLSEAGYRAYIDQKIAEGADPLPDSIDTMTLLPGEEADDVDARYGSVEVGRAYVSWINRDNALRYVRFRPAVEISED